MRRIGYKNHNLGTYETNKRSLSYFDDKQYILKNGINTLAYRQDLPKFVTKKWIEVYYQSEK